LLGKIKDSIIFLYLYQFFFPFFSV